MDWFLPRDATKSAVLLRQVVCPAGRLPVCLSVTLGYHGPTGYDIINIIKKLEEGNAVKIAIFKFYLNL